MDRTQTEFVAVDDRRREPRVPAEGIVHLYPDDPGLRAVVGVLLDVSAGGFRAAHDCAELKTGDELGFVHPQGFGRARIMWNRIVGGRLESGFLVLTES
ncbi:MAG: PilZ domain-containing protein [Acidobacteria bacterium]|nr:PilZ domain-containing protein [Acidobacteriota bacterium]